VIGQYLNDFTAIIEDFDKGEKTGLAAQLKANGANAAGGQEQEEEHVKAEWGATHSAIDYFVSPL